MVSWRLEHRAQPTTEARRSRWPKTSQSSGSITSGFECEISTALWAFSGCLGLLWCAAPRATMSRSFATSHGVELNLVFNANTGDHGGRHRPSYRCSSPRTLRLAPFLSKKPALRLCEPEGLTAAGLENSLADAARGN